jgi:hypothetical protein
MLKPRMRFLFAVSAISALALATWLGSGLETASACTLQSGTNDVRKFGGISHSDIGWTGDTRAVRADLWNYNPSPIYQGTAYWVMTNDQASATRYAQTGWVKFSGFSAEAIFAEWNNDAGINRRYWKASTNSWEMTPWTQPSSSINYNATWVNLSGTNEQVQMSLTGVSSTLTGTVTWTANTYQVASETLNFATASPTNKGDHASGDNSNRIHADNIQYYDSSGWHAAHSPLNFLTSVGNHSTDTSSVSGVGFRVWDNRCND